MAYELALPDIGEGLTEAEIVAWFVAPGEEVHANQPLVEVETDKAVVEIPSPRKGVLLYRGAAEGDVVEVGSLLAVIGDVGETWSPVEDVAVGGNVEQKGATATAGPESQAVQAVPLVRKLAESLGIDLTTVRGTGPNGQITRKDVQAAASASQKTIPGEPLSKLRRTIAGHMTRSWAEIPHVTVWGPAEATRVLESRTRTGYPVEALLIRSVLPALADVPDFSAHFDGETLRRSPTADIGIAVDTDAGLLVPVVKDATTLSPDELAKEIEQLIEGARDRTLAPEQLHGQSFTITNVGAVGGGYGTPIIPHGTTAILSVGRARDEVIVRYGQAIVAPVFPLALSFDHRVVDGAAASRFLNRVTEDIELFRG